MNYFPPAAKQDYSVAEPMGLKNIKVVGMFLLGGEWAAFKGQVSQH